MLQRLRVMAWPSVDKSPSGLGIHDGGGLRDFVCLHLQWTWLAICSCPVIWGLQSYTPTQGQAPMCILPQGKVEESPYGQISQLKVCQLLSAGPRVIYPVGLNGVTSQLPSTYQNCCIVALASLLTSTHILELTFPYLPLRSQSAQLCH